MFVGSKKPPQFFFEKPGSQNKLTEEHGSYRRRGRVLQKPTPEVWEFILKRRAYGPNYKITFRSLQYIVRKSGITAKYLGIYGQHIFIDNLASFQVVHSKLHCKTFSKLQEKPF